MIPKALLYMDIMHDYLIADAEHPLICSDKLWDEMLLYNINPAAADRLYLDFRAICKKEVSADSSLKELSGGQKVILMALLALHSPADSISFINLEHSLDPGRFCKIRDLIIHSGKNILWERA
ncbi:MAG: hypothetical protein RBQ67_00725 [Candidatus Cloacimonadaceae bacterium]|jgi:hypothetical protein|nr:hypothetical protein [Candidatus Cloacimonadaceae bacterium]HQB97698.1 hypothetical protein [Candidatus Cloacimonadota bacterium]